MPQALVLSRIRMWGNAGCFESYMTIAIKLKLDRRTVIRAVKSLIKKELITVLYETKQRRILFFNNKIFTNMPLFGSKKVVPESHQSPNSGVSQTPAGVIESPEVVSQSHPIISRTRQLQNIQNRKNSISEIMTTQAKPLSRAEFEKRRQTQIASLQINKIKE